MPTAQPHKQAARRFLMQNGGRPIFTTPEHGERVDYGRSMLGTMLPSVTARTARRMMLS